MNVIKKVKELLLDIIFINSFNVARMRIALLLTGVLIIFGCGPRINSFEPTFGQPGTDVTVYGERLVSGGEPNATTVHLGNIPQPHQATETEARFRVVHGSITGPIQVTTPDGTATSQGVFEVVDDATDPNGLFTFGGVSPVQGVKVTPTGPEPARAYRYLPGTMVAKYWDICHLPARRRQRVQSDEFFLG